MAYSSDLDLCPNALTANDLTCNALTSNAFAKMHQHAGCDTCLHLGDGNGSGNTGEASVVPHLNDDETASKASDNAAGDPSDADLFWTSDLVPLLETSRLSLQA